MALPFSNTVDRTLERLRNAFVETARGAREVVGAPLRPDLPDDDIPRLKGRIDACLEGKGGETARRGRAAELGQAYLSLTPAGRKKFLLTLAHDYGLPREAAVAAVERWRASKEPPRALVRALEPPAVHLLREFVGVPQGVKFVVDLRAELLALGKSDAAARTLSEDLRPLLSAWFDVGFLDLVRIDWKASAALLEKLVDYEAVHAIRSWRDLKNRLDSDRRCFAFFHPRMPDEPLIFVEVALVDGMAGNVQRLLDARAETSDPKHANTAIFYSISNCQQGLAGISFGNFLIKRVAEQLARDLPNIKDFATLSPIPGLRQHVDGRLKNEGDGALTQGEIASLVPVTNQAAGAAAVRQLLDRPSWWEVPAIDKALRPILSRLAARYLTTTDEKGRALDRVAHFHLGNGAVVERLNWLADTSANGLKQSYAMMVNYRYKLGDVTPTTRPTPPAGSSPAATCGRWQRAKDCARPCVGEPEPASPSGGKAADGPRGAGRSLLVSDKRCKERQRGDATQQARNYNSSAHLVKPAVIIGQSHFRDFLGSVEGSIWRVVRPTTPRLVRLRPNAMPPRFATSRAARAVLLVQVLELQARPRPFEAHQLAGQARAWRRPCAGPCRRSRRW